MKNVKLSLVAMFAFLMMFTACNKEKLLTPDRNQENMEQTAGDNQSDDDNWEDDGNWEDSDSTWTDDENWEDDFGEGETCDGGDHDGSGEGSDGGTEGGDDGGDGDNGGAAGEEGELTSYAVNGETITKIKDFQVSGNLVAFQNDVAKHEQMWEYFKSLIPREHRGNITEFIVFHGGGSLLGYVAPIDYNDLSKWKMGLAIDAAGDLSQTDIKENFAYTAIHEFAHVLTLNDQQVDVNGSEGNCGTYYTGEGCARPDSYINELYQLGWADIIQEFNAINSDEGGYQFYEKYQDRFVTDYASSNPGEDIAEVFSVFVTQDAQPTGNTIADQKVNLMYARPELVQLRKEIRKDPVLRAMVPGSWVKLGKKHTHKHRKGQVRTEFKLR